MTGLLKFDQILEIDGKKLTKKYIQSLSKEERYGLVIPIFNLLRKTGFIYMDDVDKINKSWQRLLDYEPDISNNEVFNNSSLVIIYLCIPPISYPLSCFYSQAGQEEYTYN